MRNPRQSLVFILMVALVAASASWSLAAPANTNAQELLKSAIKLYDSKNYQKSKEMLNQIKREDLPSEDQQLFDASQAKVDSAIAQRNAVLSVYNDAEKAYYDGDLKKAQEGYKKVSASEFAPQEMRTGANDQLQVIEAMLKVEQPQKPEPVAVEAAAVKEEEAATTSVSDEAQILLAVAEAESARNEMDEEPAVAEVPAELEGGAQVPVVEESGPVNKDVVSVEEPAEEAVLATTEPARQDVVVAPADNNTANNVEAISDEQAAMAKIRSQELVVMGRKAMDNDQPQQARAFFQRALAMDPSNDEAQQLLNQTTAMSASVGTPSVLTRLEQNRLIARQAADMEYDRAMQRSTELLSRADSASQFDASADAARVAQNVLETNKNLYSEAEYRERLLRAQSQISSVADRRESWNQRSVQDQLTEIRVREQERKARETQRRDRKIDALVQRAKTLISENKFGEAKEVCDQILNLDPNNEWAAEKSAMLGQFILLREEGNMKREQRLEEQKQQIDLRRSEIPWYEILKFPEDWKQITQSREQYGVERSGGNVADQELRDRLNSKLEAPLEFDAIEFQDAIQFLRESTGANIYVRWNVLASDGIERTSPVSVSLKDISFKTALEVILSDVGGLVDLDYMINEGVITISTKNDLETNTTTEVYDIRDLIVRIPNFVAPRIDLASAGETSTGTDGGGIGLFSDSSGTTSGEGEDVVLTKSEIIEAITLLIMDTIAPLSWADTGGEVGSIRELNGQLVVTQTAKNHEHIRDLISKLREARALQISIEARFISVSTGFLNSIGIDLDFYFNLGSNLGSTSVVDPWTGATVPTQGGQSGWGNSKPGNDKWTPMGLQQNSTSFTNMVGVNSTIGAGSIGGAVTNQAMSLGGTFLDDIQVDFLIQATQAHQSTRSLTAPRLTLFNGQRAYVAVAVQQAYVADLEPLVADNAVVFNPIPGTVASGAILDVEATISADRRYVTLTVRPQVTNVIGFRNYAVNVAQTDDAGNPIVGTGFMELPTVSIQQLETTVSVPDGGTLLLGGQKLSGEVEREMGVPLLNKIPILNRAFTNRGTVRDEQTLLILIKPKIIIQREEEMRQYPD